MSTKTTAQKSVQETVQEKYGAAAREVRKTSSVACGDPALRCCDPITTNLYDEAEKSGLPANAVLASLGCGNPTALIDLKPGETVLDLGSGGGIDVLLSAKRVGPYRQGIRAGHDRRHAGPGPRKPAPGGRG